MELELPKPDRVPDVAGYWGDRPAVLSARCTYWVRQILRGWRPSRRIAGEGYYGATEWYGVFLYEYLNVLYPLLRALERSQFVAAASGGELWDDSVGLGWARVLPADDGFLVAEWACTDGGRLGRVIDTAVFAEEPGGPVTWSFSLLPPMVLNEGDRYQLRLSVQEALASGAQWSQLPMGVTLVEAMGEVS